MRLLLKSAVLLTAFTVLCGFAEVVRTTPVALDRAKLTDDQRRELKLYPDAHALTFNDVLEAENDLWRQGIDLATHIFDLYDDIEATAKLDPDSPRYATRYQALIDTYAASLEPLRQKADQTREELYYNLMVTDQLNSFTEAEVHHANHIHKVDDDNDRMMREALKRLQDLPIPPSLVKKK